MPTASTNCWTCKQRKVGCDRALPYCLNCQKGQRTCQGYGIRLAWPDKQDGRRKQKRYEVKEQKVITRYLKQQDGCLAFLNTVVEDLNGSKLAVQDLIKHGLMATMSTMVPMPMGHVQICEQDGMLLNHYDMQIARMTTTIDDESNGFRLALIPMALSSPDLSARSILHTTLAIACYHLGRPQQALKHKFQAIKDLSDSLATLSIQHVDYATRTRHFAASMMLCVYGVFDESDTAWHMHLEGAKLLLDTIPEKVKSAAGFEFLKPWFRYHYIFSQYTYPPHTTDLEIKLPDDTPENSKIIGVLGCSTEVLELIGCINQLRGVQPRADTSVCHTANPFVSHPTILARIENRLLDLQQVLVTHPGSTSGTIDNARIISTAELYRIAAVLYFYQIIPATITPVVDPHYLLCKGLNILWEMNICSSPWPLFILACSVSDDVDRIRILDLMETSGSSRRIGNYSIIIALVEVVWKRQDLMIEEKAKKKIDWRDLVEESGYMPSFI
ncbi:uncharacterized protein M421DRAFT_426575 [Didymella exigua CBS 183.55]|uniref:Zn(2)-C6 fungal-type domain-containing protein n=1 Tax=Didymella exigua CBS 183.55 TaxID=1150837 RepID=A0A6A5R3U6_9PLEO|nr:uncharacterized protein M421DRAFT_426575 [Didymella exigua CBS 183.55]KAF1922745.1 hypothetical protein M421DRAFT_426575 [Didymella exigua CBS 183.55]